MAGYLSGLVRSGARAAPAPKSSRLTSAPISSWRRPASAGIPRDTRFEQRSASESHSAAPHLAPAAPATQIPPAVVQNVALSEVTPSYPAGSGTQAPVSPPSQAVAGFTPTLSSTSQAGTRDSDSPMRVPKPPVELLSGPKALASPNLSLVSEEPRPQPPEGDQITAPELHSPTFLRPLRIEFTEVPPNGLQNRIGPFPSAPESVITRPVRISYGPVESLADRQPLRDEQQLPLSRPARRLPFSANRSETREAPVVAAKEKKVLNAPVQPVPVLPVYASSGVRDVLPPVSNPRHFESSAAKKEESGGLSIGNLEIQIIQEDAPAASRPATPSPSLADDWDMDRRYVRRLG